MTSNAYQGFDFARQAGDLWPRLSLELTEIRHPEWCQSCGTFEADGLTRWREHNDRDQPQRILVVLCKSCADALIEPHPRLYAALDDWAPWPGCMPICVDCVYRCELGCTHPNAKVNGGMGVMLTMPQPFIAFVDGRTGPKGGRRYGGQITVYHGPVTDCAGREKMARQ